MKKNLVDDHERDCQKIYEEEFKKNYKIEREKILREKAKLDAIEAANKEDKDHKDKLREFFGFRD